MIKVKFSPGMQAYKKHGPEIEVTWQGGTIGELLDKLEVDRREIGSVLVNEQHRGFNTEINDECEIYLLPVICGG